VRAVCACLIAVCFPGPAFGQRSGPQLEVRAEVIAGEPWYALAGAGASVTAGVYTRLGINGAAGVARTDSLTLGAARVDGTLRFLLDPLRQSAVGVYGVAGVSGMYLEGDGWSPRVLLGIGLEGRARGGTISSIEVALGGGTRVSFVMRRARADRR